MLKAHVLLMGLLLSIGILLTGCQKPSTSVPANTSQGNSDVVSDGQVVETPTGEVPGPR